MLLVYFVGYSSQVFAWQRHIEPAIILTLGVFSARQQEVPRRAAIGPLLLGFVLAVLSEARIWGALGRMLG